MGHDIELVAGSAPRMQDVVRAIAEPFREATAVWSRLHANDIAVHVIDARPNQDRLQTMSFAKDLNASGRGRRARGGVGGPET